MGKIRRDAGGIDKIRIVVWRGLVAMEEGVVVVVEDDRIRFPDVAVDEADEFA